VSDLRVDGATLRQASSKLQTMTDDVAVAAPLHDSLSMLGSSDVAAALHDVDVAHGVSASSFSDEFTSLVIVPSVVADELDAADARLATTANQLQ
jgi:hypothetical protein